jgi:hypothetical protein
MKHLESERTKVGREGSGERWGPETEGAVPVGSESRVRS